MTAALIAQPRAPHGPVGAVVVGLVLLALLHVCCDRRADAWIAVGSPHLEVVVLRDRDGGFHATATLNGELKGNLWNCPLEVWSCENEQGLRVRGSQHVESPCTRDTPQRMFAWDYTSGESCRVRLALELSDGKRPLTGVGPQPLQWGSKQ